MAGVSLSGKGEEDEHIEKKRVWNYHIAATS